MSSFRACDPKPLSENPGIGHLALWQGNLFWQNPERRINITAKQVIFYHIINKTK